MHENKNWQHEQEQEKENIQEFVNFYKDDIVEIVKFWKWLQGLNILLKWFVSIGIPFVIGLYALIKFLERHK